MATDNLMPQSSTSVIKHFMLRSSTTGQGLTGKVAADFSGKYNIAGGAEVTLSFSNGTAGDAYSSGKICPLGLGTYAWHVPNAVFASLGNVSAVLSVTGGIDVHCEWLVVTTVRDTAAFGANTTTPDNASITAIKAKTDNLPSDPADQSAVEAAITAATSPLATQASVNTIDDFLDTEISAIKTKTDQLTFTTANKVDSTAVLDSATQTQIDNIETSLTTLGSESTTVERSTSDTNAITFSWPVSGATITGTRSLNNGAYGAVTGAIAFLRSETGKHYYTLAYNSADRPAAEGQVRYKFVDGTYTGYVVLRTVNLVTEAQVNAQVLDVLSVDTFAELSAPPAATSSLKDKITWLFMYARNKVTQTATTRTLYRDDTTTVAGTSGTSDNGTTFTKGEDA